MRRFIGFSVAIGALVAGCTPTYVAPRSGALASVSLSRAELTDRQHAKLMVTDQEGRGRADISGRLLFTYDVPTRIPAAAPMIMEVQTLTFGGSVNYYCGNRFAFVPAVDRSYRVTPQMPSMTSCAVTVVDAETGQPAPALRVIPIGPGWMPAD